MYHPLLRCGMHLAIGMALAFIPMFFKVSLAVLIRIEKKINPY